jgi:hypothetical protein
MITRLDQFDHRTISILLIIAAAQPGAPARIRPKSTRGQSYLNIDATVSELMPAFRQLWTSPHS